MSLLLPRRASDSGAAWLNRDVLLRTDRQHGREQMNGEVEVLCTELELSDPTFETVAPEVTTVRVLVRLHRIPMGFVSVAPEAYARPDELVALAFDTLRAEVVAHLVGDGEPASDVLDLSVAVRVLCPRPLLDDHVTVVIGTRNRPEHVRGCLQQLSALEYASYDVVVVDNAPSTDATAEVVAEVASQEGAETPIRYVRLEEAGVSRARNAGIDAARGPLVAFVDDDVRVDSFWLQGVARAFATSPAVTCVTGLVAARTITGSEQLYFDSRVSWSSSLEPHVFHPTSDDPLHPWAAGRFGAGANMAFRLDAVRALGGFDTDLGPGTKAKGGEDIDLFVRALRAGGDLRYDPAALAWHIHRSDPAALQAQLFGYGVGLTAYLFKHALSPAVAAEMVGRLPRALRHILTVTKVPQTDPELVAQARHYRRVELGGMVLGPLYYVRSRLASRGDRRALRRAAA